MRWTASFSVFFLAFLILNSPGMSFRPTKGGSWCLLPKNIKSEISAHQGFVNSVIHTATKGTYAGKFLRELTEFIDTFGNRMSGTENLEEAITHIQSRISFLGLKVEEEQVKVPYWIRGNESAELLSPRGKKLGIMGLGSSTGTNETGITADVIVVSDFNDLKTKQNEVRGKIVLFNSPFTDYEQSVRYRNRGPAEASRFGAVAALVRSITPFSIYSPHTGSTTYGREKPIPAASVTLEDADLMARMYAAGQKPRVKLIMGARMDGNRTSKNLFFDIKGNSEPVEYVTISGHIDSWDVGQGALDDGGGAFLTIHSILLLLSMNVPRPRRTIRGILWTGEEQGLLGAKTYLEKHEEEIKQWTAAFESDNGLFAPAGLRFNGSTKAACIMKEVLSLFKKLNATTLDQSSDVGSDISVFSRYGVPLMESFSLNDPYFWFHHTDGDSLRTLDSAQLDKNLALFAATSYIIANLSTPLPKPQKSSGLLGVFKLPSFLSKN